MPRPLVYSVVVFFLPATISTAPARNMTATAAHVRSRYLPPLYAYTPIPFPYLLIIPTASVCTIVVMADATRRERRDSDNNPQLPNGASREVYGKREMSTLRIVSPVATVPTA